MLEWWFWSQSFQFGCRKDILCWSCLLSSSKLTDYTLMNCTVTVFFSPSRSVWVNTKSPLNMGVFFCIYYLCLLLTDFDFAFTGECPEPCYLASLPCTRKPLHVRIEGCRQIEELHRMQIYARNGVNTSISNASIMTGILRDMPFTLHHTDSYRLQVFVHVQYWMFMFPKCGKQ